MLETLIEIDTRLLYFFHIVLKNPVTDLVMPVITSEWFVRALFLIAALLIAVFGGRYGRITFLILVAAIILTDQLSSQLIKPLVGRPRPCKTLEWIEVLVNCGSGRSFPSSHAANTFGQALVWMIRYRRLRWWCLAAAALISLSRITVGVHYPFDVLAGAILGTICGLAAIMVAGLLERLFRSRKALDKVG